MVLGSSSQAGMHLFYKEAKVKLVVDLELGRIHNEAVIFERNLKETKLPNGEPRWSDNFIKNEVKKFINEEMRDLRELRKGEKR